MNRMLIDTFEIVSGLLKSRTKRIINYINDLSYQVQKESSSGVELANLETKESRVSRN